MNFEDIVLNTFETEGVIIENLNEGFFPLSPTLAFLTLKRNMLGKLHKAGKKAEDEVTNTGRNIKSKGLIAKEKARAGLGMNSGVGDDATVYKLTKQQKEVLSEIYEKYGNEIIDDVIEFRKNVLAPYQLIKRIVKNNKIVTAKDKFGMTHAQYKAAVESGKKKIEKRGGYHEDMKVSQQKIDELSKSIDALRELEKDFDKTGKLKESIVNRVLKNYNLTGSDFEGVSLENLKKTTAEIRRNTVGIQKLLDKDDLEFDDLKKGSDLIKRNIELRKGAIRKERQSSERGKNPDDLKEEFNDGGFPELKRSGNFNAALGKYLLRSELRDELSNKSNPRLNKIYKTVIREMIKEATERHSRLIKQQAGKQGEVEFNSIERKIFKVKGSVGSEYTGNIGDYVQVIKDSDFSDPKYIKRPPKLIAAEKKVEAEIKRFERSLKSKLDKEDYDKLKKYRLINNLITVKEMKSPEKLFKSPNEIGKGETDSEETKSEE